MSLAPSTAYKPPRCGSATFARWRYQYFAAVFGPMIWIYRQTDATKTNSSPAKPRTVHTVCNVYPIYWVVIRSKSKFIRKAPAAKHQHYMVAMFVCLFVSSSIVWNAWCCLPASGRERVSRMFPPVKNLSPREIYASGGGLLVAPINAPFLSHQISPKRRSLH